MKYELEKEEMQAIYNGLNTMISSMLQVFMLSIKNEHEINLKKLEFEHRRLVLEEEERRLANDHRKIEYLQTHADYIEPMDEYVVQSKEETQAPKEDKQMVRGLFKEPTLTQHQKNGKAELQQMLVFWLQGYKEDVEQPNRAEYMENLGNDGTRAGAVISYCMVMGGLTKAVWNCLGDEHKTENAPQFVRELSGNIAQVASCFLSHLADQYDYPNPLLNMQ